MAGKKPEAPVVHRFEEPYRDIGGKRWYNGVGNPGADILFVDSWPGDEVKRTNRPLSDRTGRCLQWLLKLSDIDPKRCYYTYAVKFPMGGKKPTAAEKHACEVMLAEEIEAVKPKVVVAFGADAWASVADVKTHPFGCCRGEPVKEGDNLLFATLNLPQVMMNGGEGYRDRLELKDIPQHILVHTAVRELKVVKRLADGEDVVASYNSKRPHYDVVEKPEDIDFIHETLRRYSPNGTLLCLDCEWEGENWLDPDRYIRTIQIGYDYGKAFIVRVTKPGGESVYHDTMPVMAAVKRLLEDPAFGIVGHNVISDGEWLLQEHIDIRNQVVYDTMLGEYLLCEDGPFGLEECAMKYAPYGRYCCELECWLKQNPKLCKKGFGLVPDEILLPYGAADVDCLRYIMDRQLPMLKALGYMKPRGVDGEYPSMLQTTLNTQRVIYEIEGTGLNVDMERLNMLTDAFQSKRAELLAQVVTGAAVAGMPDFNPGSSMQVRELLFQKLGLAPVKTTEGKDWAAAVGNRGMDDDLDESPGTDKQTLEILGDAHPLVHALLQFRRVDQYCKTWLRHRDPKNPGRGIEGQLWFDGRLHPHMSQLSTTSRFKSSAPNCFPADTEVLTSNGWIRWDKAYELRDTDILLAQWDTESDTRDITFAKPEAWHFGEGELVRYRTQQQLDVVCTPNHKFWLYCRKHGKGKEVSGFELGCLAEYLMPQAGRLVGSPGKTRLSDAQVTLLCATQADGHICHSTYKGEDKDYGVEYAFNKARKCIRLRDALNKCGVPFHESLCKRPGGKNRTRFYVGKQYAHMVFPEFKHFSEKLLQFDADTLRRIGDEVFLWDGHIKGGRWRNYASAEKHNTDWVQALQTFCGRRGRLRTYTSNTGSVSYQIDVVDKWGSGLANGKLEWLPGVQPVYCVTMPKGTVVTRRNGKVAFTKQSQNFPKKAEGFLAEIFGKDNVPPVIRTIVVPPKGHYMVEADFQQAELFTIASLSNDPHMIDVLRTPGRDMHTSIAAKAFGYHMYDENHKEWTEDDIVELVAKQYGGDAENDEFKQWQKHLVFRDSHGTEMSYSQFKSGPRISGKNVNFGILYGRGAADTAIQVKAETGTSESLDVLTAQLDAVIKTWKEVEYPIAWQFIESCMAKVYDPGYIVNPFGRIRRAPFILKGEKRADAERNFANYPVQSTVSDAVQLAMDQMQKWREEHGMKFQIQNQIHDAVMLNCPFDELEEVKDMFHKTLGNIHIPKPSGGYFILGVDIDVYDRWGVKI